MPAYNFHKQFAELVELELKRQTIRPPRMRPTVPGDRLQLYTKQRTITCRKLGQHICKDVKPLLIDARVFPPLIVLYTKGQWRKLDLTQMQHLALNDGFPNLRAFVKWFERYEPGTPLELILW